LLRDAEDHPEIFDSMIDYLRERAADEEERQTRERLRRELGR
jgi:hypothetical protein